MSDGVKVLLAGLSLVISVTILLVYVFVLKSADKVGSTYVERKVFENSYQKVSADKSALAHYDAQIAQLRGKLANPDLTGAQRAEINAQITSINILKSSKVR